MTGVAMALEQQEDKAMETTSLRNAYRALLDAADAVAGSGDRSPLPPAGEWNADQILAHVVLINAATIATVSSIASGSITTYDNRVASDVWTIDRVISLAGGNILLPSTESAFAEGNHG
jgi:hypothetical protein